MPDFKRMNAANELAKPAFQLLRQEIEGCKDAETRRYAWRRVVREAAKYCDHEIDPPPPVHVAAPIVPMTDAEAREWERNTKYPRGSKGQLVVDVTYEYHYFWHENTCPFTEALARYLANPMIARRHNG